MEAIKYAFFIVLMIGFVACTDDDNDGPDPMPGQVTAVIGGENFTSNINTTDGSFSELLGTRTIEVDAPAGATGAGGTLVLGMIDNSSGTGECITAGAYGLNAQAQLFGTMAYFVNGTTYTTLGQDIELSITVTDCNETDRTISGDFSAVLQIGIDSTTISIANGRFNQISF